MPPKNPTPARPARRALTPAERTALRSQLQFFRHLRAHRGDLTLERLRALRRLLAGGAETLYRLADRVERDSRVRTPRRVVDELATRAGRLGAADDPALAPVHEALAELRGRWPAAPRDLRATAIRLLDLADSVENVRLASLTYREQRRPPPQTVGRPRNRLLEQILDFATRERIPDAELARALADVKFPPDGPGSREASLADRWTAIIKSARARRRRRDASVTKS